MKRTLLSVLFLLVIQFTWAQKALNERGPDGYTPLIRSILESNKSQFDSLIKAGADPSAPAKSGEAPLLIACRVGNWEVVPELLAQRVYPSSTDSIGRTPVVYAVKAQQYEVLSMLISAKANVDKGDPVSLAVINRDIKALELLASAKADLVKGLELAERNDDTEIFDLLLSNEPRLKGSAVVSIALEKNKISYAKKAIEAGFPAKDALEQVLPSGNHDFIVLALENGASGNEVIDYAVNRGDPEFLKDVLTQYGGKPDNALEAAHKLTKTDLVLVALESGADADIIVEDIAKKQDLPLVEKLLDFNATPEKVLYIAVKANNLAMSDLAIRKGAKVSDNQLISWSVENKNLALLQLLLKNGGTGRVKGVVASAVEAEDYEMTRTLLEASGDPNEGIDYAVKKDKSKLALLLLENGADGSRKGLIEAATEHGDRLVVEKLLVQGAPPSAALSIAIKNNDLAITRVLIDGGAIIHDPEYLWNSIDKGQDGMTRLLLEKNAPTNYVSKRGESLLHLASEKGKIDILRLLIGKGLSVKATDRNGDTPLHIAAGAGKDNLDVIKILLDAGAELNARNTKGLTPLDKARGKKTEKYLTERGGLKSK